MGNLLKQRPDGQSPAVAADRSPQYIQFPADLHPVVGCGQLVRQFLEHLILRQVHEFLIQLFKLRDLFIESNSRKSV